MTAAALVDVAAYPGRPSYGGPAPHRAKEFWRIMPIWQGRTVFVIGRGPSLLGFDFDRLRAAQDRGAIIVAINAAVFSVPFATACYFTDNSFFARAGNPERLAEFHRAGGLIFTASRRAKIDAPDMVRRIALDCGGIRPPGGFLVAPAEGMTGVRTGRTSGHVGLSLAIATGAALVPLLGFDFCHFAGETHFDREFRQADKEIYAREFLATWQAWGDAARRAGVRVVNCSARSALDEFERGDVAEFLGPSADRPEASVTVPPSRAALERFRL